MKVYVKKQKLRLASFLISFFAFIYIYLKLYIIKTDNIFISIFRFEINPNFENGRYVVSMLGCFGCIILAFVILLFLHKKSYVFDAVAWGMLFAAQLYFWDKFLAYNIYIQELSTSVRNPVVRDGLELVCRDGGQERISLVLYVCLMFVSIVIFVVGILGKHDEIAKHDRDFRASDGVKNCRDKELEHGVHR